MPPLAWVFVIAIVTIVLLNALSRLVDREFPEEPPPLKKFDEWQPRQYRAPYRSLAPGSNRRCDFCHRFAKAIYEGKYGKYAGCTWHVQSAQIKAGLRE